MKLLATIICTTAFIINIQAQNQTSNAASRLTEPSAEIASSKPNQPVRKESFPDKVKRIETDGNKIGILFKYPYNYVKPYESIATSSSFAETDAGLRDTIPAYKGLKSFGEKLVSKLNADFGTTIFELVDLNQIPYRKVQFLGERLVDDWWSTKYKILIHYTIDSYYEFSTDKSDHTEGKYSVLSSIMGGWEFRMDEGKPKQDILFRNFNMGNYYFQLGGIDGELNTESLAEATKQFEKEVNPELVYKKLEKKFEKRYKKLLKRRLK